MYHYCRLLILRTKMQSDISIYFKTILDIRYRLINYRLVQLLKPRLFVFILIYCRYVTSGGHGGRGGGVGRPASKTLYLAIFFKINI